MQSFRGSLGAALLALSVALVSRPARATQTTVLVAAGGSEAEAVAAERLWAELRSAGYQVYKAEPLEDVTCSSLSPVASTLRGYGESAWMQVSVAPGGDEIALRVCYRDTNGRLTGSALQVPAREVDRGALASVEALNGLRAQPSGGACEPCAAAAAPVAPAPSVPSALAGGAAIVFDPLGLGPIVGATAALKSGISERLALSVDAFAPLRAHELSRSDRTIAIDIAWLRLGPTFTWPLWAFNVSASLGAGPALVWADAKAVPPLIGVSRRSAAAVFSAGGALELPRDAPWFLRGYYEITGLLPRIDIATGDDPEHLGPLLFELGASLGLRWSN